MEAVAAVFRTNPGIWIDGRSLQFPGGQYAWRTRVSDARRLLGMRIENRVRKVNGKTVSEYRYLPKENVAMEAVA